VTRQKSLTFISHLVVFIVCVCLCGLGTWQLARYQYKTDRAYQIADKQAQMRYSLSEVMTYRDDKRDLPVLINGQVLAERALLLDNRQHNGKTGFAVIAPVQTNQGMVLVNFGWIEGMRLRAELPQFVLPTQLTAENGVVAIPGKNRFVSETAMDDGIFPKVIQEVDFVRLSRYTKETLAPFMVTLLDEDPQFVRRWQPVVMPAVKHLGYAMQWFALAVALIIIYWRLLKRKPSAIAASEENV
jgi:cytochrome oxidase assembly protein ShyY1